MNILLTGGAGFIGSNLLESFLENPKISNVRVIDNLETGFYKNIAEFENHPKFEFRKIDIRNYDDVYDSCEGIDKICHQAALGSVPRSMDDPLTSNKTNVDGTLNIFKAAIEHKINRVVFASSSSVYGDDPTFPKVEKDTGNVMSPYALTKSINELYANLFSKIYDFNFIALRYFNVFGPKQNPGGAYAAVIPIFIYKALENIAPTINGDGSISRDFTYISNVVDANTKALFCDNPDAINQAYNVGLGDKASLNELWTEIKKLSNADVDAIYGPVRAGDVPHSLADVSKAKTLLSYNPTVDFSEGLKQCFNWYKNSFEEANS